MTRATTLAAAAVLLLASAATRAQPSTQPGTYQVVTRATFAGPWPFTVDQGTLSCYRGQAIIFSSGGRTYALNGTALSAGKNLGYTWERVNPIWRDSPDIPGTKVPVSALTSAGQKLCKPWP